MKKRGKTVPFLKQKSYLLASVLMLAAVFGMAGVYFSEQRSETQQQEQAKLQQEQEIQQLQQEAETAEVDQIIRPQNNNFLDDPDVISRLKERSELEETPEAPAEETETAGAEVSAEEPEDVQETAAPPIELHFDPSADLIWPLEGEVLMGFSMDQTTYFKTLDSYRYNPALVIQGNVNDKVLSVAAGKVVNIETNNETGCTVTVDLGDGYSAMYGQLKEVSLSAGDYVEAGEVLGYVSEPTKYYSEEGPNLYFQMIKDNESVDPMEFLQ